ncbi:MAG: sensor histidine kinase, partial [Chitinophagaceae bacterium]
KRIAQELHDGILSRLFGARLNLDSLNRATNVDAREKSVNYLNELKNIEQDIREISHDLNREKIVLINNFLAILTNLFEEQSANFDADIEMEFDDSIKWDEVSNTLKINIYRIFQEALQNINKYAKAKHIKVALTREDSNIILDVVDDGVGFDVDRKSKGIGVQNMVSRANECNGTIEIKSKKGNGTAISIIFPTFQESSKEDTLEPTPVIA